MFNRKPRLSLDQYRCSSFTAPIYASLFGGDDGKTCTIGLVTLCRYKWQLIT
jgi:hypothetical protein